MRPVCSGEQYASVPSRREGPTARLRSVASNELMPKSMIVTLASASSSSTLLGLMSLCTTPARCTSPMARASWTPMRVAWATVWRLASKTWESTAPPVSLNTMAGRSSNSVSSAAWTMPAASAEARWRQRSYSQRNRARWRAVGYSPRSAFRMT